MANVNIDINVEEPIQEKTWQQKFTEKLEALLAEKKDAAGVVFYREAITQPFPGPSWEMFKKSIAYKYWRTKARKEAIKALKSEWS